MINSQNRQSGFAVLELLLIVAVVGLLAFVGWRYYNNLRQADTAPPVPVEATPEVIEDEDLDEAQDFLEDLDVDRHLDTSSLDPVID